MSKSGKSTTSVVTDFCIYLCQQKSASLVKVLRNMGCKNYRNEMLDRRTDRILCFLSVSAW